MSFDWITFGSAISGAIVGGLIEGMQHFDQQIRLTRTSRNTMRITKKK